MKTVTLNNGVEMPQVGYGVYQISPEECKRCVMEAIRAGYRLIDTAQAYYNEEGVGEAIVGCGIPREELFITTKVWISNAGDEPAARSIDESLRKLHTDYIDLLLVHQPFGDYYGTYRAMERACRDGKVRAVVQLETHVYSQQLKMRGLIKEYGTRLMAWSPLAQGMNGLFADETLKVIGLRHGKTNAQVALKFLVQEGIVVIPKTTHPERMASNLALDDFLLTTEEMEAVRRLDTGRPLAADFNDPALARLLLEYDRRNNPASK